MCLITFAYRTHPHYNLVLVANRDEFYRRPTQPLAPWPEHPGLLAGRDLELGGTWLGLHRDGRLSAVTNYRDGRHRETGLRSRGHLTRDFLLNGDTAEAQSRQLEREGPAFGGFNLLLGDTRGLYYLSNRGHGPEQLRPGLYGLSNALLDTPWPKLQQARRALADALHIPGLEARALAELLADRNLAADPDLPETGIGLERERALSSCFIQLPEYGTRATSVILQDYDGNTRFFEQSFNANGPTGFRDHRFRMPVIGAAGVKIGVGARSASE
ncbi:NRDE family protein [Marinobacterium aestuariivivens]|uniref:NRDE family protein n=1 Tax=Marinobacterium aestuariivivens TaxID=1698799 RepID=A0ABW2A0A0_9GAMM